MMFQL
jgi:alpha-tubulin suppressor-like RCC1 family protein